ACQPGTPAHPTCNPCANRCPWDTCLDGPGTGRARLTEPPPGRGLPYPLRGPGRGAGDRMNELRTLLPYLKPYRRGILAGLPLVVIAVALAVATPRLRGLAVDALDGPDVTLALILGHAALIIAATIFTGAARFG